jgi:hypothetical protein
VGTIKGIGRIYQQTGIDTHCNLGFAKVYKGKTALTAADLMNDKVLPFFDEHGIRVLRVLTDNGMEFRGRLDSHPYELFLHINDIEHTRTKVRRPQTNGSVERLNQTIQDEFYQVAFQKKVVSHHRGNPGRPGCLYGRLETIAQTRICFWSFFPVSVGHKIPGISVRVNLPGCGFTLKAPHRSLF